MENFDQKQPPRIVWKSQPINISSPDRSPRSEGSKISDEVGFENSEIARLRRPMEELITKMHRAIENGEYRMIIGDDASGRIPTFVFDRFLKHVYEKQGDQLPETFFFAGSGRGHLMESLEKKSIPIEMALEKMGGERLEEIKRQSAKVLVVTDTLASGSSLTPLSEALTRMGIVFEIASIGGEMADCDRLQEKLKARIFFGEGGTPAIYGLQDMHGVWKDPQNLFAEPLTKNASDERATAIQEKINSARRDAIKLSDELVEWYEPHMKSKKLA